MQQYWADNQVSVTITFKPHEAEQIKYCLEMYEDRLKGVSFLPYMDPAEFTRRGYEHPPMQKASKEEIEAYITSLGPLDLSDQDQGEAEKFCDGDACLIQPR